jgi:23S rRNA (uracil1939-C5)-methyltransferase
LQASPHAFGYRNRLRLRIDATGVVHFFNAEKRPDCVVLEPDLRERVARVRALSEQASELFAAFEHLELRSADLCGIGGLWLAPRASTGEASTQAVRLLAAELPDFAIGVAGNAPVPWQRRAIVEGVFALVPLDAFVQVNSATNADLVAWLRAWAVEVGARSVLDLYAGAGNFSLALAARGLRATAVETHAASIDALAEASRLQRLPCEGFARTAHEACLELAGAGRSFDLVVLDPPRAGALATAALAASLGAPHMALCSCDVESFARDLGVLTRHGYRVHAVRAFDMFPHTHHIEVLALLQRTL